MKRPYKRPPSIFLFYRIRQVYYYLYPKYSQSEIENILGALEWLTSIEKDLFLSQALSDQTHCLRVYNRLNKRQAPQFVLWAALFHDSGKPQGYGLFPRILGVVVEGLGLKSQFKNNRYLKTYFEHEQLGLARLQQLQNTSEIARQGILFLKKQNPDCQWGHLFQDADRKG